MTVTDDIKRMPEWIKFLLAIAVSVVASAITYGEFSGRTNAKIEALEQRVDKLEQAQLEDRREVKATLEGVRSTIGDMRLDVARLCTRLKCKE